MPIKINTAKIMEDLSCKECGWPIIHACCNEPFTDFKDSVDWDWWYYCSNKGCKNHSGEGVFQTELDWIKYA